MGLDWMKRLKITIKSNTEAIKIHNIRMDENEKRILKLENEFKDLNEFKERNKGHGSQDKPERKC